MRTAFGQPCCERFNMSLGTGLGRLKGRAFRIGHLGDFNDLMLMGTLCGVEMGLGLAGIRVSSWRRRCGPRGARVRVESYAQAPRNVSGR